MIWSPNVDTGVLILTAAPDFLARSTIVMGITVVGASIDGLHAVQITEALTSHIIMVPGAEAAAVPAALIPLDRDCLGRIEALNRFWLASQARPIPPDTRLTRARRRRLRLMLQAVDGHADGATYREIAMALYGVARVNSDPWKTSPLRDSIIALVRDGLGLVAGDYRHLLRHRRRV